MLLSVASKMDVVIRTYQNHNSVAIELGVSLLAERQWGVKQSDRQYNAGSSFRSYIDHVTLPEVVIL